MTESQKEPLLEEKYEKLKDDYRYLNDAYILLCEERDDAQIHVSKLEKRVLVLETQINRLRERLSEIFKDI